MVKPPSFGKWLASHDVIWQAQFVQNMKYLPIFIIFYAFLLGGNAIGVDKQVSTLLSLFGGATWFILVKMWELTNMQDATKLIPINMTIRYNKTNWPQEINIIRDYIKIDEDKVNRVYSYGVALERPIRDVINDEEFSYFILKTPYDWATTMAKVNKCLIAHNGSVFEGPASLITVVWASDFRSVVNEEGKYEIVPHRVFNLLTCPEDGEAYQQAIGVISPDGELARIEKALKTFDTNNSVKTLFQLRDANSLNENLVEKSKDTGDQIVEHVGTFLDNDRFIRKPAGINWRSTRTRLALILGAGLLGAAAYWYIYVRPGVK